MTRPLDRHLDSEEFDALVRSAVPGQDVTGIPEDAVCEIQDHVKSCLDCHWKVQMYKSVQDELSRRLAGGHAEPGPDCRESPEWVRLGAGLLPESEAKELMKHAAQCDHCGPLLRTAMATLSEDATPEEEALVSDPASARPEWSARMAASPRTAENAPRLKKQNLPWWGNLFHFPRAAFAFAALVLVVAASWIGMRQLQPQSVDSLLARAYTERRTLELRIPGAQYAPLRIERGAAGSNGGGSSLDKPESLLRAELQIGETLRKNPNDPAGLESKARADLLEGNYESAIKSLQRALETTPDSPQLLTDLGSAYFLRAESTERAIDYGNAIEAFGKALSKNPDDPIALYNRALVCERIFNYTQSVDDWEHYLRMDKTGPWADDARAHLAAIKEKLDHHAKMQAEPLLTPAEITKGQNDRGIRDKIDGRIEDYLSTAVAEWLPQAYPVPRGPQDSDGFRAALQVLSEITAQRHSDRWLADLLSGSSQPNFPQAAAQLSAALKAFNKGDNVAARQEAAEAARLFGSQNVAGTLRSRVEFMFASQDAQDGDGCVKVGKGLGLLLKDRSYTWLQAQYFTESGDCTWILGNLGEVQKFLLHAARSAELGDYGAIYLRTQDHLSLLAGEIGDLPEAWAVNQKALARYWASVYPAMRGYNLYYDRYEFADSAGQPHLQMAAWRDGVDLSEALDDSRLRAMAHSLMASAAVKSGKPQTAEAELARASELFAASPQNESTEIARLEAETRFAGVKVSQGKGEQAVAYLRDRADEVSQHPTNYLNILFYTTLGEAESQAGHIKEADTALRHAVLLADLRLQSLHDDDSRMQWSQQSSGAYRDLVQQQLLRGDPQGALEIWEWYRGAELRAGRSPAQSPSDLPQLDTVASRSPSFSKQEIVTYAVLPHGVAVWVYDNRGVFSTWIAERPEIIQNQAKRFRELCSDSTSESADVERNAQILYRVLIAPIEERISSGRLLVIEADDQFAGIPFEALMDREGRYLGDRVAMVASAGLYYKSDARASLPITAESAAMVVAVPNSKAAGDSAVTRLPDALDEGEAVTREFRDANFLRGSEATLEAVAGALPAASLFHFAGHATANTQHSGLLLADSFLNASALRKISLAGLDLAVLSACDTQGGSSGNVSDADGLVRVFLVGGVPNVVASRWSVDSAATRQFMDLFYGALLKGSSVPESMRQARAGLRSRKGMDHPYYWAAFSAFGLL